MGVPLHADLATCTNIRLFSSLLPRIVKKEHTFLWFGKCRESAWKRQGRGAGNGDPLYKSLSKSLPGSGRGGGGLETANPLISETRDLKSWSKNGLLLHFAVSALFGVMPSLAPWPAVPGTLAFRHLNGFAISSGCIDPPCSDAQFKLPTRSKRARLPSPFELSRSACHSYRLG